MTASQYISANIDEEKTEGSIGPVLTAEKIGRRNAHRIEYAKKYHKDVLKKAMADREESDSSHRAIVELAQKKYDLVCDPYFNVEQDAVLAKRHGLKREQVYNLRHRKWGLQKRSPDDKCSRLVWMHNNGMIDLHDDKPALEIAADAGVKVWAVYEARARISSPPETKEIACLLQNWSK